MNQPNSRIGTWHVIHCINWSFIQLASWLFENVKGSIFDTETKQIYFTLEIIEMNVPW